MNFSIISSYTITTTTLAHEYFLSVSSLTLISGLLPIFSDYFSNNVSTNYSYTDLLFYFISSLALRYLILFFSVKLIISILMLNNAFKSGKIVVKMLNLWYLNWKLIREDLYLDILYYYRTDNLSII